jgi:cytochrome d ubiquinol oxidase subunit II
MLMVTSLIFRGLAFEFRLKAIKSRWIWDWSFIIGHTTGQKIKTCVKVA